MALLTTFFCLSPGAPPPPLTTISFPPPATHSLPRSGGRDFCAPRKGRRGRVQTHCVGGSDRRHAADLGAPPPVPIALDPSFLCSQRRLCFPPVVFCPQPIAPHVTLHPSDDAVGGRHFRVPQGFPAVARAFGRGLHAHPPRHRPGRRCRAIRRRERRSWAWRSRFRRAAQGDATRRRYRAFGGRVGTAASAVRRRRQLSMYHPSCTHLAKRVVHQQRAERLVHLSVFVARKFWLSQVPKWLISAQSQLKSF